MTPMTETELRAWLSRAAGRPVTLRMNTNSSSIVDVRNGRRRGELKASVHRIFLDAPPEVLAALAGFMRTPTARDRAVVRSYIAERHRDAPERAVRRKPRRVRTLGEYYDLAPIASHVNESQFGGRLEYSITWGRRPQVRPRRQTNITLGLCQHADRHIRIHPILDDPDVPRFFLEYVVHHEMAHLAVPARVCGRTGRHHHHTPEFYAVERAYPRYCEAVHWQRKNLDRLMRKWCRSTGRSKPPPPHQRFFQLSLFGSS